MGIACFFGFAMQLATEHVLFYPAGLLLTVPFSAPASAADRPALIPSRCALPRKPRSNCPRIARGMDLLSVRPCFLRFFLLRAKIASDRTRCFVFLVVVAFFTTGVILARRSLILKPRASYIA